MMPRNVNTYHAPTQETSAYLNKKYGQFIHKAETVRKEDLDLANHLVGLKQTYLKLSFLTVTDMQKVRKDVLTAVRRNKERAKTSTAYTELLTEAMAAKASNSSGGREGGKWTNPMDHILDAREYDLPLHVRVSIDKQVCTVY